MISSIRHRQYEVSEVAKILGVKVPGRPFASWLGRPNRPEISRFGTNFLNTGLPLSATRQMTDRQTNPNPSLHVPLLQHVGLLVESSDRVV